MKQLPLGSVLFGEAHRKKKLAFQSPCFIHPHAQGVFGVLIAPDPP